MGLIRSGFLLRNSILKVTWEWVHPHSNLHHHPQFGHTKASTICRTQCIGLAQMKPSPPLQAPWQSPSAAIGTSPIHSSPFLLTFLKVSPSDTGSGPNKVKGHQRAPKGKACLPQAAAHVLSSGPGAVTLFVCLPGFQVLTPACPKIPPVRLLISSCPWVLGPFFWCLSIFVGPWWYLLGY